MTPDQITTAQTCHSGALANTMAFPAILGSLGAAGFEGYLVDYRSGTTRYYLTSGDSTEVQGARWTVALPFTTEAIIAAIREAQANGPGYTYSGFCRKLTEAGCAGYLVSLPGKRVVYFGRSAETHVEHFPGTR